MTAERGDDKKFLRPLAKSFWRRALHPFLPEPAVLRPALRARAGRNAGKRQKGRCRPPHGLALKARRGFAGTVNATAKPAAAVDLSHQTLAVRHGARPFAFRRSLPALPVSAVGLDDPACRGAEGGRATGSRLTYCFTLIKPATPLAVAYRNRRCWQRRGLKLPGQRDRTSARGGSHEGASPAASIMRLDCKAGQKG